MPEAEARFSRTCSPRSVLPCGDGTEVFDGFGGECLVGPGGEGAQCGASDLGEGTGQDGAQERDAAYLDISVTVGKGRARVHFRLGGGEPDARAYLVGALLCSPRRRR